MKVCFFGRYDNKYSRNRILISGLKQNDVEVIECRTELTGIKKYFDLIKKHRKIKNNYDVLFVAFPGWHAMILAKFLTKKPIIFDAFASIYDSEVFDRKNVKEKGLKAKYLWILDWLSCKLADKVLLDTEEHINFFVKEFRLKRKKFERVFIGVDDVFLSLGEHDTKSNEFIVHFHGTNIPLQGIDCILKAAKLLEGRDDIRFVLIGPNIKTEKRIELNLKNVEYVKKISYDEMPNYIDRAGVCLGIFGDTEKARRVIPNKVYECIARKKPTITTDTLAIKELFGDGDLLLVPASNYKKISEMILYVKENKDKIDSLIQNSYNKLTKNATPAVIGRGLKDIIENLL